MYKCTYTSSMTASIWICTRNIASSIYTRGEVQNRRLGFLKLLSNFLNRMAYLKYLTNSYKNIDFFKTDRNTWKYNRNIKLNFVFNKNLKKLCVSAVTYFRSKLYYCVNYFVCSHGFLCDWRFYTTHKICTRIQNLFNSFHEFVAILWSHRIANFLCIKNCKNTFLVT
jgi:hypothetical protein